MLLAMINPIIRHYWQHVQRYGIFKQDTVRGTAVGVLLGIKLRAHDNFTETCLSSVKSALLQDRKCRFVTSLRQGANIHTSAR